MGKGGRYIKKKEKKRSAWKYVLLALLLIFVAVVVAGIIYWNSMLNLMTKPKEYTYPTVSEEEIQAMLNPEGLDRVDDPAQSDASQEQTEAAVQETLPENENIVNIMLVGQQSRKGEEAKLSDTMILCTINRETKTLTMTSFLRDLYVPLPAFEGHSGGRNRINVCYNLGCLWTGSSKGGMDMLALCIEQNFGIPIDHSVEIDFDSFIQIIDLMGGVEIDLTSAEASAISQDGYFYRAGVNLLDGESALRYARLRKIDNDFGRTNRQRTVVASLLNKCRDMNLFELHALAKEVLPMITTDMSNSDITGYLFEFLPMLSDLTVVSQTCPVDGSILEGSYWYRTLDIAGIESHVIEADLEANGAYIRKTLGLE